MHYIYFPITGRDSILVGVKIGIKMSRIPIGVCSGVQLVSIHQSAITLLFNRANATVIHAPIKCRRW